MQALGSRRGGWITLAIVALAVVVAAIFAAFQLLDRPGVDAPLPAPGSAVAQVRPTISFAVDSGEQLGDLKVVVDGVDVTRSAHAVDGRVTVSSAKLSQGEHAVRVSYSSDNLFSPSVARSWSFAVNTSAPKLVVAAPRPGSLRARRAVKFEGRAEPGSDVSVAYRGARPTRARTPAAPGAPSPACPRASSPPPSRHPTPPATPPSAIARSASTPRRRRSRSAPRRRARSSPRRTSRWSTGRRARTTRAR